MAGSDIERINEFIRNLTGRDENFELSNLSSAQKARVIAWADTNGISLNSDNSTGSHTSSPAHPTIDRVQLPSQSALSVGIDIQSCSELFPETIKDLKSSEELLNIFTLREIAYAENKQDSYTTLTGLFAAKEAVIKANQLSLDKLNEIEIQFNENGKPFCKHSKISISHSLDFSIAIAVSKSSLRSSEASNTTSEKKILEPTQSTKYSNRQVNRTAKSARQNSNLFRLLFATVLAILFLGLGFSFGINFEGLFK